MRCYRCKGWMVLDQFMDLRDDTGRLNCEGWRCLNCGEMLDPVVLCHRVSHIRQVPLNPLKSRRRWPRHLVA